jgi:uncharacterized OsmC-like protein
MTSELRGPRVNGMDLAELNAEIAAVEADVSEGDREASITSRWVGGLRSAATSSFGGPTVFMGGDDEPGAMGMLLRSLAACDIEVVVTRATLLGVVIRELWIEVKGSFNVASYLGVETAGDAGYQQVSLVVHLKTDGATLDQIQEILGALEGSPVGDTLRRSVPVTYELATS